MNEEQTKTSVLLEWGFPDSDHDDRGHRWFLWYGVIAAFFVALALFSDNFLFAVVIILFSLIIFLQSWQPKRLVTFQVTPSGVQIDGTKVLMRDIAEFWIAYDPPKVEKLYFVFASPLRPTMGVPLMGNNPLQVREILLQYLPENLDREEETVTDSIGRVLKI